MLLYIDYLDHTTSNNHSFKLLETYLRFDLLIFGRDTLCMSVPACVKLKKTTELLIQLDDFWKNKRILLQLDMRHKGAARNYFANRKNVLAKSMSEQDLYKHFEFVAYQDARTENFYSIYLPQYVGIKSEVFVDKEKNTDELFRLNASNLFVAHHDNICQYLDPKTRLNFYGIVQEVTKQASNNKSLFQRSLLEDYIEKEYNPTQFERQAVAVLLDRSFALANAETNNAYPLSLISNQLTGRFLAQMLKTSYNSLYTSICKLSWPEIYKLSCDEDWIRFINYINAFIHIIQDSAKKKQVIPFDDIIQRFSDITSLYRLLSFVKSKAIDLTRDNLYEAGMFSEAQNMDIAVNAVLECYSGRFRMLFDIIAAIDIAAGIIHEKTIINEKYGYLNTLGKDQSNKKYEIMR